MKQTIAIVALAGVALGLTVCARIALAGEPCGSGSVDCCTLGGVFEDDADLDGHDIIDADDSYPRELTSDTAPRVGVEKYQNAWPRATANTTGANHVEAAGMGVRYVTVTNVANMAGEIITTSVSAQGVVAQVAKTEGAASPNGWAACAALTTAQCACLIYDLYNGAGAVSGIYVDRTDATCSDSKVFYGCTPGVCEMLSIVISSGGTVGMTATHGADGIVVYPGGMVRLHTPGLLAGGQVLKPASSSTLGVYDITGTTYTGVAGATFTNGANFQLTNNNLSFGSAAEVQYSSTTSHAGAKDVGTMRSAAGLLGITNGAGTVVQVANYGRLGSATIDTSSLVAQTLFTVPAGRVAYPQRVVVRDPSAAITVSAGGFGFDANCTDWLTGAALTVLTGSTSSAAWSPANGALTVEGAAAGVFCFKTSAQEAAADTVVIDVYGVLQ